MPKTIAIRLSDDEARNWDAWAKKSNMALGAYVRGIVNGEIGVDGEERTIARQRSVKEDVGPSEEETAAKKEADRARMAKARAGKKPKVPVQEPVQPPPIYQAPAPYSGFPLEYGKPKEKWEPAAKCANPERCGRLGPSCGACNEKARG